MLPVLYIISSFLFILYFVDLFNKYYTITWSMVGWIHGYKTITMEGQL